MLMNQPMDSVQVNKPTVWRGGCFFQPREEGGGALSVAMGPWHKEEPLHPCQPPTPATAAWAEQLRATELSFASLYSVARISERWTVWSGLCV